ncbi:hypothetical protein K0U91_03465 [Chryseobacterium chendengshani]|uniref:hypothetical protein n=1 Tax=Chryseobacterium sp. LJ668 TaxID=2864040 RepID=UPI001C693A39|nr:hypothetical protein [Chryseobacterium sp. LJ668]MBW8524274.1 hypothetical protein [Chryseobacterium sp. LJ668]QYK17202.1 hypothetical protein K0U91_03465 [Chryseobacterium sp. LJ668]
MKIRIQNGTENLILEYDNENRINELYASIILSLKDETNSTSVLYSKDDSTTIVLPCLYLKNSKITLYKEGDINFL